jgi:hypothetical protein
MLFRSYQNRRVASSSLRGLSCANANRRSTLIRNWRPYSAGLEGKRICPSCSTSLPTALPTCPNCFHIEPLPPATSHFDVFGIKEPEGLFSSDLTDLRKRFLQAQRICHPDTWSRKGEVRDPLTAYPLLLMISPCCKERAVNCCCSVFLCEHSISNLVITTSTSSVHSLSTWPHSF